MTKINLQNLRLFANNNIVDIGKFLIRLFNFIFKTIQDLITNNLNINDIDFFTKNKSLVLSRIDTQEYINKSNDQKKIDELDQENKDLRNQITDLNSQIYNYKDKIAQISVNKNQEIENLSSKIVFQNKQINEFKKLLQAIQQKTNNDNKNIKVI